MQQPRKAANVAIWVLLFRSLIPVIHYPCLPSRVVVPIGADHHVILPSCAPQQHQVIQLRRTSDEMAPAVICLMMRFV